MRNNGDSVFERCKWPITSTKTFWKDQYTNGVRCLLLALRGHRFLWKLYSYVSNHTICLSLALWVHALLMQAKMHISLICTVQTYTSCVSSFTCTVGTWTSYVSGNAHISLMHSGDIDFTIIYHAFYCCLLCEDISTWIWLQKLEKNMYCGDILSKS